MTESALFALKLGICSRGKSSGSVQHSAVRYAAYQLCTKLKCMHSGRTYDYRKKKAEHVGHTMLTPDGAPAWAEDPGRLWSEAEASEGRCNSQTARWIVLSIPRAIPAERRMDFAVAIMEPFRVAGMCVQIDIHSPPEGASDKKEQPHIHATLTMRRIGPDGFGKKEHSWTKMFRDGKKRGMRASIASRMNDWMAQEGLEARVDPRTNKERGLPEPTEPNLPRWMFDEHKNGRTPEPLAQLLTARSVRRKGLTLEEGIRELDKFAERASSERASLIRLNQHKGSIGRSAQNEASRRDRRIAAEIRTHYNPTKWLPPEVARNIKFAKADSANGSIFVSLQSGAYFIDRGDRIDLFGAWDTAALEEVVEAAARNRWEKVEVFGDLAFQTQIAVVLALREPPIPVANFKLAGTALRRVEATLREREMVRAKALFREEFYAPRRTTSAHAPNDAAVATMPPEYKLEYRPRSISSRQKTDKSRR